MWFLYVWVVCGVHVYVVCEEGCVLCVRVKCVVCLYVWIVCKGVVWCVRACGGGVCGVCMSMCGWSFYMCKCVSVCDVWGWCVRGVSV